MTDLPPLLKGKNRGKNTSKRGYMTEYLEYPGQHWVHNLVFNKFLKKCLGFLIDFISVPVIAGFTSAAAITIATGQVKALLGIKIGNCSLRGCQRCLKWFFNQNCYQDSQSGSELGSISSETLIRRLSTVKINSKLSFKLQVSHEILNLKNDIEELVRRRKMFWISKNVTE